MSRWNAVDKGMLAKLVQKYGAESVYGETAKFVTPVKEIKKGGRRPREIANFAEIWAHVELRRDKQGTVKRNPVSSACNALARDLKKYTANQKLSSRRVSGMYYKAQTLFRSNSDAKSIAADCLERIRGKAKTSRLVLPSLWKREGEKMVSTIFDTEAMASAGFKAIRIRNTA